MKLDISTTTRQRQAWIVGRTQENTWSRKEYAYCKIVMAQRISGSAQHGVPNHAVDQKGDAPGFRSRPKVSEEELSPRRSRSRQSRSRDEERNERQRKEEQYLKWQAFKAKQRSDKHAVLKEKLALQQELIRANEELHFQRQVQEDQRRAEIREHEHRQLRQVQEALTQHGKIDLESERKEARTKRRAARKLASKQQQQQQASSETGDKQETGASGGHHHRLSVIESRGDFRSGRLSVVSSSEEEDEEAEQGGLSKEGNDDTLPYQRDLYKIFGRKQASYFLRPRIEPEQKKVVPVPPALKKQGGRAGVNALWGTLRDQSTVKLQRADSKIPRELKAAYGAFVRECLTNNKTVAKRSFYSEEGIPDSEKLQDGSYHQRVKDVQKKVELMYRAALTNEDKAAVLLFNNPIPDYNNLKGTEGPLRYHPSWMDEGGSEDEEADYRKWIREMPSPRPQLPPLEDLPATPVKPQRSSRPNLAAQNAEDDDDDDSMSWDSLPGVAHDDDKPDISKDRPPKLSFLTEAQATVPGQFRKRWEAKRDATGRFVTGKEVMARASLTDEASEQAGKSKTVRSSTAPPASSSFASQSSSGKRKSQTAGRKDWQPLSMTALEDHKPAVPLLGQGSFAQGQEFMWKPIVATSTDKLL